MIHEIDRTREKENKLLNLIEQQEIENKTKQLSENLMRVSKSSMKEMLKLQEKSSLSFKILMLLGENLKNEHNAIFISQKALCQKLEVSRQSIHKALKILQQERWIKILRIGTANAYIFNEKVFWSSDIKKRRYANFLANVITTEEEQDKSKEDWESIEIKNFYLLT